MVLLDKFQKKEGQKDNRPLVKPTSLDLKLREVEGCKIDYAKSAEELIAFYDEQKKKLPRR